MDELKRDISGLSPDNRSSLKDKGLSQSVVGALKGSEGWQSTESMYLEASKYAENIDEELDTSFEQRDVASYLGALRGMELIDTQISQKHYQWDTDSQTDDQWDMVGYSLTNAARELDGEQPYVDDFDEFVSGTAV